MANLQDVAREAYEKRMERFAAKYGQQAQEVIRDITTSTTRAIDRYRSFDPTTTIQSYSHYGPTPMPTSAVWDSAATATAVHWTEPWSAWILSWPWRAWAYHVFHYVIVRTVCFALVAYIWGLLLRRIPQHVWLRMVHGLRWIATSPGRAVDNLVLWFMDKTLGALGRFVNQPWIQQARADRARLWRQYKCVCLLSAALVFMFHRNWNNTGCWVKIHDLQHQGLQLPEWAFDASRKQHGHRVELFNKYHLFHDGITTTLYDEEPATQYLTATTTVKALQEFTKTVEVVGQPTTGECTKIVHEVRINDGLDLSTVTIHETVTLDAADATHTITVRETAAPESPSAAPEVRTVTSYLTGTNVDQDTTTVTKTVTQYQSAEEQDPFVLPCLSTKWEILANVTPTTVHLVRTTTSTKTFIRRVPDGTIVRTKKIPATLTVTDTSTVTSLAKKVSTSIVYIAKTTVPGGTLVRTTRLPHTTTVTVTDTSVIPGPTCALGVDDDHEEEHLVCEDVGKSVGYCKKCQQYHCCELRS